MERWEKDMQDLRSVCNELETIIQRYSSPQRPPLPKYLGDILEAKSKVKQCYINCLQYGFDTESKLSSAPQERK